MVASARKAAGCLDGDGFGVVFRPIGFKLAGAGVTLGVTLRAADLGLVGVDREVFCFAVGAVGPLADFAA